MNKKKNKTNELIILGSGPAGLSASIYASRYKIDFTTIGQLWGGTITEAHLVENYPGTGEIKGSELASQMTEHAKSLGTEILAARIKKIVKEDDIFNLYSDTEVFSTKRILLTIGTKRNKLDIKGEEKLLGRGVSYCATCDGAFYKGRTVCVVGGGNAAITAALYLNDVAKKVYIIYRGKMLKADPSWLDRIEKAKNIEIILESNAVEIIGKEKVEGVKLDKDNQLINTDGVFIEIGSTPSKALFKDLDITTDNQGYVLVDSEMKTSQKGVWAAGDITQNDFKLKQIITAASEGAIAAYSIYLDTKR